MTTAVATGYEWATGARFSVAAQIVGEVVEKIVYKRGSCDAESLVQVAREPASPLHRLFEWDDAVAAEQYRREQARHILRTLIIDDDSDGPAFVHVIEADGYMQTTEALRSDAYRPGILADAKAQLKGLRKRYRYLSELAKVWSAVDEVAI